MDRTQVFEADNADIVIKDAEGDVILTIANASFTVTDRVTSRWTAVGDVPVFRNITVTITEG